jgi:tRNA threonylcarbamoyl adenosine modification protein (Sua5/YciO/YrdC/YwlC family)
MAVFVESIGDLWRLGERTVAAERLAESFLPGPLTLVLRARVDWPAPVVVDGRIGLRLTDAPVILKILREIGEELTATSANRSGSADLVSINEIAAELGNAVDLYLDAGTLDKPLSTVVDGSVNPPVVLREGAIARARIETALETGPQLMSDKYVILFVCTGNTCRSPMAHGALRVLLEKERPGKFEIESSGIAAAAGFPATMYAIEAARMWDADLRTHSSQPLSRAQIDRADLILGMSPEHVREIIRQVPGAADKTYLFKNFPDHAKNGEPVDDPIGQSLDRYNETFLEIGEYMGKYLPEIVKRIDAKTNAEK